MITQWDWADPKAYLHDEISTDKRNPRRERQRPDLRIARGEPRCASGARSGPPHDQPGEECRIAMPNTPGQPKPLEASPVWGDEAIWDSHTTVHNPMFDETGACGSRRDFACAGQSGILQGGIEPSSAKITPVDRSGRQLAVYDPKTKQVSMIDTCFATHHLLFAEDANNTLWTSSGGGGGVVGWLNTKDVGPDSRRCRNRRAGRRWCSTPTATASAIAYVEGRAESGHDARLARAWAAQPRSAHRHRSHEGYAPERCVLWPGDRHGWIDLGHGAGIPGRDRAGESGVESAGDGAGGILRSAVEQSQGAGAGLFAARHGHRPQQRGLGGAGQRALGQLRPAQMQRAAERTEGDGSALSRRLDAVSDAGAELQERDDVRQRRLALLRLGGSVRHVGPGQEHADRHGQWSAIRCSRW